MKARLLHDRVLVERLKSDDRTPGGIVLPDAAKEKPRLGTVVAVGPGRLDDRGQVVAVSVRVGDRVYFSAYAGSEVTVEGKDYLVLNESEILLVMP